MRFESRIWPGSSGCGPLDQLVAGGEHADPGPGHDRDLGRGRATASTPRWPARQHLAGREHRLARLRGRRRPGARGCRRAPRSRTSTVASSSATCGALDHHDGVGAVGHRRAGHDADRLARPDATVGGASPARIVPTTREHGRARRRRRRRCRRPARRSRPSRCWRTAGRPRRRRRPRRARSPSASASGTATGASGVSAPSTWARASSSEIMPLILPPRRSTPHGSRRDRRRPAISRRGRAWRRARRGRRGTRGRGPRGRWRARPWPAGSRASCRCRSGPRRTGSRRRSGRRGAARWRR